MLWGQIFPKERVTNIWVSAPAQHNNPTVKREIQGAFLKNGGFCEVSNFFPDWFAWASSKFLADLGHRWVFFLGKIW